ncbi:hypothetical protein KEM55_006462, partial [Ascosphaera atra]
SFNSWSGPTFVINNYLVRHPETRIADLSYTTTARRMTYACRAAVLGSEIATVEKELRKAALEQYKPTKPKKVAFVFTGQGRIYASMARSLFEASTIFRTRLLQFQRLAVSLGFPRFQGLVDGSLATLVHESPLAVQLGTVCTQMALNDLLLALGIQPIAVVGHSLGEYAAFYSAGLLPAVEVIRLVGTRAQLMVDICEKGSYSMLAIKASETAVRPYSEEFDIACINGPDETVLAGPNGNLVRLQQILDGKGMRSKFLDVPYAFHSGQMKPLQEPFENTIGEVFFAKGRASYISAFLGRVAGMEDFTAKYFAKHMREPVLFHSAIATAKEVGVIDDGTVWFEIGNHPVCCGLIKSILGQDTVCVSSLRSGEEAWKTMNAALADLFNIGVDVDWHEYHREYEDRHTMINIPHYALNLQNYWIPYKNDWALYKGNCPTPSTPTPVTAASSKVSPVIL